MDFIKNFKPTPINILKALGILLVALFVLSLLFEIFGNSLTDTRTLMKRSLSSSEGGASGEMNESYAVANDSASYDDGSAPAHNQTTRGSSIPSPYPRGSVGDGAEDFEVTEYTAHIETRDKARACNGILELKSFDYVIFENAQEYDKGCSYTFKVQNDEAYVEEVYASLEALNPKELSENTYTIQKRISDLASEEEILREKLASIDETLESALRAYDDVTALATQTQNAEALAQVISSKVGAIERLTQERLNITAQLERLTRAQQTQRDKLSYTYFYVSVYENAYIDGERIQDSWKHAVQNFITDINKTLQNITIGLASLLFILLQYIVYFFILLIVAKYLWRAARYIWEK